MAASVETKVYVAGLGGGFGAIATSAVLWVLGVLIWHAKGSASAATDAIAAVPSPIAAFVGAILAGGGAFLGGWIAKHTPRPEDAAAYQPKRVLEDSPADPQVAAAAAEDDAESSSPEVYPIPEYASV